MLLFRTAAVAGGQRTGGAGRDAALRADAYPVAVSVFRALVAAHRLRRVGAALCAFVAADAAAVRSFGCGRGGAGAGPLRRLPRRRTDSCRACGKRCTVARRGRAAARLLQQRRARVPARRVRRGRVFVQPRGRGCTSSTSPRRSAQVFSPAARCRRHRMEHIRTKARKRSIFPQPSPRRCRTR